MISTMMACSTSLLRATTCASMSISFTTTETARLPIGLPGPIGKRAVSVVVKEMDMLAHVVARSNDVEQAIIVEIIHDQTACHRYQIEPRRGRCIDKAPDAFFRRKYRGRN